MQLRRVDIQNFLSIERAALDFRPGIHYLGGVNHDMCVDDEESNGAGKSALFDAVQWCLFGSLARGKVGADGVVNNVIGKNCRVMLTFEHNGKTYVILRTRKDEEFGNSTKFWIDGVPHTQHRTDDTKEEIAEFLPITEDVFLHAIQIGQGMPHRFLSLSEPAKHDLICQIANVTVFDIAAAHAKDKEKAIAIEVRVLQGALQSLKEQRIAFEGDLRVQIDALKVYRSQKAPDLDQARQVEAHLDGQITKLQEEIDHLRAVAKDLSASTTENLRSYAESEEPRKKAQAEIQVRSGDLQRRHTDLLALHGQLTRISEDIQQAKDSPNLCLLCKKVPQCNPAVDCANLKEYVAQKNEEYATVAALYGTRSEEYASLQEACAQWQVYHTSLQEAQEKARKTNEAHNAHISQLNAQMDIKRTSQATFRKDKEELSRRISHHAQEIAALEARISQIESSVNRLNVDIQEKEKQQNTSDIAAKHWGYWVTNVPNLRAAAISKLLSYVNQRISYYMQVFSAGAMGVELYQKAYGSGSKIQVDLRTAGGTYVASSGGERRRVDLAVFLALFDLLQVSSGIKFNVLVCDEIMDSLSPAGVKNFATILRQKANEGMSIFVVSHNIAVRQVCEFDTISTVEKRRGCATLVTQENFANV